jgi:hypothetical protein
VASEDDGRTITPEDLSLIADRRSPEYLSLMSRYADILEMFRADATSLAVTNGPATFTQPAGCA